MSRAACVFTAQLLQLWELKRRIRQAEVRKDFQDVPREPDEHKPAHRGG